ncbi:hypothetical protein HMPREF9466_00485 [Fusobacterium necrophorum subsp. funduliforme 1_1_36S]|nr:hypothetical protein HMPREF9466_00485 [Fusobacterium necrophorum subsp. funduliforme 1_1_36S]
MWEWIKNIFKKNKKVENMEIRKLEYLISTWLTSKVRQDQLNGERYYRGNQDILQKKEKLSWSKGDWKMLITWSILKSWTISM